MPRFAEVTIPGFPTVHNVDAANRDKAVDKARRKVCPHLTQQVVKGLSVRVLTKNGEKRGRKPSMPW